jgi:hypothetical protein
VNNMQISLKISFQKNQDGGLLRNFLFEPPSRIFLKTCFLQNLHIIHTIKCKKLLKTKCQLSKL